MSDLVRIPHLGPPRPISSTEKVAGVDAKLINDTFCYDTTLISKRHGKGLSSHYERHYFAVQIHDLANFVEAYCLNDWVALPGNLNAFDLFLFGYAIEFGINPLRYEKALRRYMDHLVPRFFCLPTLLEAGGLFFDYSGLLCKVQSTPSNLEKPHSIGLLHTYADIGWYGVPNPPMQDAQAMAEYDRRFASITDYSFSLSLANLADEPSNEPTCEENTDWPTDYLKNFIKPLVVYEVATGIPILPASHYQAEMLQSWSFQQSRRLVETLITAYLAIEDSARKGEEIRARVLSQWVRSPNITMPPCFVALLSGVRTPEELPEALIKLRKSFEPFRDLRRQLETEAANESLEKFTKTYRKVSTDITKFTASLSAKVGELPAKVPTLSTPLVQADLATKFDQPSSVGDILTVKSAVMNQVLKLGRDGIEYALLRRRLRPLHSIASKVFNAPLVPRMIEKIWNVSLDDHQRKVIAMCGQSREVFRTLNGTPAFAPETNNRKELPL